MPVCKDKSRDSYYYSVHYVDLNGTSHRIKSKRFKTQKDAKNAEAKFLIHIGEHKASSEKTFHEMIEEYIDMKSAQVKPTTLTNITNCLSHTDKKLGKIRIDKLTNSDWQKFLRYLESLDMKNHRRNRIIEYTCAVINLANRRYDIYTNVPSKFDKYKENDQPKKQDMQFWTPEQFKVFLSVIDDVMYKSLFLTLFGCGMRSGEALALLWKDIDFKNNTISINKTLASRHFDDNGNYLILPPKTESSIRTIAMPDKVADQLKELYGVSVNMPTFDENTYYVFGNYKAISNSTMQGKKRKYYLLAKQIADEQGMDLPEIRVHSFRHSCASMLINAHATITYISAYLGHSSVKETLDTYSHFFPNETKEIAAKINNIL